MVKFQSRIEELGVKTYRFSEIVVAMNHPSRFGTDLVRPRERSSGNWGIGGTLDAEPE